MERNEWQIVKITLTRVNCTRFIGYLTEITENYLPVVDEDVDDYYWDCYYYHDQDDEDNLWWEEKIANFLVM